MNLSNWIQELKPKPWKKWREEKRCLPIAATTVPFAMMTKEMFDVKYFGSKKQGNHGHERASKKMSK